MTTQTPTPHAPSRTRHAWHYVRHYLEMVVAMVVGMVALGPVADLVWPGQHDRLEFHVLVMATTMAIGMGAWMRFRGHSWRPIAEMSAAMYVPFVVLFVPYWAGAVSGSVVMDAGHLLMLPLMALAMAWRRDEYR
jgi:hypothetical protein